MSRYKMVDGSESKHCCFSYSIIDLSNFELIGEEKYYETVCECFSLQQAEKICDALNKGEE